MTELRPQPQGYQQQPLPQQQQQFQGQTNDYYQPQQQFNDPNVVTHTITINNSPPLPLPNSTFPYNTHFFPATTSSTHHIPASRDPRVLATLVGAVWNINNLSFVFSQFRWVYSAFGLYFMFGLFCAFGFLFMLFYSYKLFMGPGENNAMITTYPTDKPILIPPPPSTLQPAPTCLNFGTLSAKHRVSYTTDNKVRSLVREMAIANLWGCLIFFVGSFILLLTTIRWISPLYYGATIVLTVFYAHYLNAVIVMEHESREEWAKWCSFDENGNLINPTGSSSQQPQQPQQPYPEDVNNGYAPYTNVEQYPAQYPQQAAFPPQPPQPLPQQQPTQLPPPQPQQQLLQPVAYTNVGYGSVNDGTPVNQQRNGYGGY